MKTPEELNLIRNEYDSLSAKLRELTEDELKTVTGGTQSLLPKDHYENIILGTDEHDEMILQP